MLRVLHSSDLHLGKPFGTFPEDVRGRLRQARHDVLGTLAQTARDEGASHILLAGDTFDAETPSARTLRQALNAMAGAVDITWVLLPGNHDSLRASAIWEPLARDAPPNVMVLREAAPLHLRPGVCLLPAPCTTRDPGRDLSDWMDGAETGEDIRLGLAHGPIQEFTGTQDRAAGPAALIAPDRARRAGLDYLALGDWHGQIEVSANTWYSGTPEADSFKHGGRAGALLVSIAGRGAPAQVTPVATGRLLWQAPELTFLPGQGAPGARLEAVLPVLEARADTLLRLRPDGRLGLADRADLVTAFERIAPDFLHADMTLSHVAQAQDADDLSRIAEGGALRRAADALSQQAEDDPVAARALGLLFDYALQERAEGGPK